MANTYEEWMKEVRAAFDLLDMPMADWQVIGVFDYRGEYEARAKPEEAAQKANRYWWQEWNKSLNQECLNSKDCWLPRGHEGECQPVAELTLRR